MKPKLLLFIFTLLSTICLGQNNDFSKITINGLEVFKKYSKEQVFTAFGTPNTTFDPDHVYSEDDTYIYRYITNNIIDEFSFTEDVFMTLRLKTPKFSINNYLRVGDNISKLSQMGGKMGDLIHSNNYNYSVQYWQPANLSGFYSDVWLRVYYENNIIIKITISAPF